VRFLATVLMFLALVLLFCALMPAGMLCAIVERGYVLVSGGCHRGHVLLREGCRCKFVPAVLHGRSGASAVRFTRRATQIASMTPKLQQETYIPSWVRPAFVLA